MSKKPATLSNGTLSLRFMQRGATQQVTPTVAKVSDEAEWDIGPVARAALGIASGKTSGSNSQSSRINVTHDDSYISFVFDRDSSGSTSRQPASSVVPGRRRVFRQGTEVSFEPPPDTDKDKYPIEDEKKEDVNTREAKAQRPRSISESSRKSTDSPDRAGSNVRRHRLEGLFRPPTGSGFVKPAGIVSGVKRVRTDEVGGNNARRRRS